MSLNVTKALEVFNMADYVDLDCGSFEIRIAQAAVHNEAFRAAVATRSMRAKRRSVVPEKGSLTGSFEEDVELFLDVVVQGFGERKPLRDDDGNLVAYTKDVGRQLFTSTKAGKVLFGKVMRAACEDETFSLAEDDRKN